MAQSSEKKFTLLRDAKAADEDYRVKDLLNYGDKVSALGVKVENTPERALIGIVGEYGIGKSVMLNKYREHNASDSKKTVWIHFDAWKYPDRSALWEGFVLDFVEQYNNPLFESMRRIIDGEPVTKMDGVIEGSLEMIPVVGKGLGKIFTQFTATSPAKRVFQIQKIFSDLLSDELRRPKPRRIYIEIEDADRSGIPGINFIETLSHFLRNFPVEGIEIKALIPIARLSFDDEINQRAYVKALDIVIDFEVTARDMSTFVETIFNKQITDKEDYKKYIVDWCQRLLSVYNLTPRQIKFIIRGAEATFQTLRSESYSPDPLLVLLFESSKMIRNSNNGQSYYNKYRQDNEISSSDPISLFIKAMSHSVPISQMADVVNDTSAGALANDVRFSTHEKSPKIHFDLALRKGVFDSVIAEEALGHYWLPAYYVGK